MAIFVGHGFSHEIKNLRVKAASAAEVPPVEFSRLPNPPLNTRTQILANIKSEMLV
jgi:hypothetical protein